jgi:hypothetical protein
MQPASPSKPAREELMKNAGCFTASTLSQLLQSLVMPFCHLLDVKSRLVTRFATYRVTDASPIKSKSFQTFRTDPSMFLYHEAWRLNKTDAKRAAAKLAKVCSGGKLLMCSSAPGHRLG